MIRLAISVVFTLVFSYASGQNFLSWQYNDRYFSAQAGAGFSSYRGELKHNNEFQNEFSNFSIGMEARLLSKVAARVEFAYFNIRGNDDFADPNSYELQRNLSFESKNFEFSLQGVFYLRKYAGAYYKRSGLDPYIFGGIGLVTVAPETELGGVSYKLRPLETENISYSGVTMLFPVGIGLKFKINPYINFITEASYRMTMSDYLDDVSTSFPEEIENETVLLLSNRKDESPLVNEEAYDNLLIPGGPRGEPENNDKYLFLSLKFEFFIPPVGGKSSSN